MNKTAIIIIGAVLSAAVAVVVVWLVIVGSQVPESSTGSTVPNQDQSSPTDESTSDEVRLDPSGIAKPGALVASVEIEDSSYTPATITVKKGATVTWINKDGMGHNVVSDSDAPAGGPPKTAELFGRGETFSFTYNTVGEFPYHCTPHPFMQGVVKVEE